MGKDNLYIRFVKNVLPSPFSIAVLLTVVTFAVAWLLTEPIDQNTSHTIQLLGFWEKGFWELLSFSMQMVLILILGHTLALSSWSHRILTSLTRFCSNNATAAAMVSFISIGVSTINWGLSLIIGAVFVRKVGEYAQKHGIKVNYPLLGAAGYSGMMTWHGGLSGSAPLKVAESNHFLIDTIGVIPINETVLSAMNLTTWVLLLVIIPLVFYYMGAKSNGELVHLPKEVSEVGQSDAESNVEKLDHTPWLAYFLGGLIILFSLYKLYNAPNGNMLALINLNYINFVLFGLCLITHGTISKFLKAVQEAVSSTTGIIIQFPLYAGIMGIMKYSGLVFIFSSFFIEISSPTTFPLFTLFSAGVVNTFVPSGGGQWVVQGPIVCEAARVLGVSMPKAIMALSYGDQLTNMIQPFWALPLLGITKLKAKEILPYSFAVMILGVLIFTVVLLLF